MDFEFSNRSSNSTSAWVPNENKSPFLFHSKFTEPVNMELQHGIRRRRNAGRRAKYDLRGEYVHEDDDDASDESRGGRTREMEDLALTSETASANFLARYVELYQRPDK